MIPRAVIFAAQLAQERAYAEAQFHYQSRAAQSVALTGVPAGTHLAAALEAVGFHACGAVWLWRASHGTN